MGESIAELRVLAGAEEADRLLRDAPAAILRGEAPPEPAARREGGEAGGLRRLAAWIRRPFS